MPMLIVLNIISMEELARNTLIIFYSWSCKRLHYTKRGSLGKAWPFKRSNFKNKQGYKYMFEETIEKVILHRASRARLLTWYGISNNDVRKRVKGGSLDTAHAYKILWRWTRSHKSFFGHFQTLIYRRELSYPQSRCKFGFSKCIRSHFLWSVFSEDLVYLGDKLTFARFWHLTFGRCRIFHFGIVDSEVQAKVY